MATHDVPPPRSIDPAAWQRTILELNTQIRTMQAQVTKLAARVAALEAR